MLSHVEKKKLRQQAPSALREATIQDPPLTGEGFLRVELDAEPGALHECPFTPLAPDAAEPMKDDAAVVMESDGGNFWVLAWWPNA